MAGILHFQNHVRLAADEANPRGAAAGVAMDIPQAILHQAEDRRLDGFFRAKAVAPAFRGRKFRWMVPSPPPGCR
jgi:hypothetical protein